MSYIFVTGIDTISYRVRGFTEMSIRLGGCIHSSMSYASLAPIHGYG